MSNRESLKNHREEPGQQRETLRHGDVHVWMAALDLTPHRLATLETLLTDDERERARRFLRPGLAERFIAARGQVRETLARYLDRPAAAIRFTQGAHGKPALARTESDPPLTFNVSHAGDVALIAVARDVAIGVDVEAVRSVRDMRGIAEHFFSPAEREELAPVPDASLASAFYRCWTWKEAFLKAIGTGLTRPLDSFDVSIRDDESPALLRVADDLDAPRRWTLVHLEPAAGYVGAVAVECRNPTVRCRRANTIANNTILDNTIIGDIFPSQRDISTPI